MTSLTGTATSAASVTAGYGIAVLVFLAPKFYFILLGTLDASLAHLLVVLDLCVRKSSVLPEDDVETQSEDAKAYKYQGCKQNLHLVYEARTDLLVVVHLADDACEDVCHREYSNLACVL